MTRLLLAAALALWGCSPAMTDQQRIERDAESRLSEKLGNPDYLRVQSARLIRGEIDGRNVICGTVSYNDAGKPSQGAERFVVFPGIVAIEGQPTVTFTFEHLYEQGNCAA